MILGSKPLQQGGAKAKSSYDAKLTEFRKTSAISWLAHFFNFHQKFLIFFLVKDMIYSALGLMQDWVFKLG